MRSPSLIRMLEDTIVLLGCDIYERGYTMCKSMKLVSDLPGLSEIIAKLGLRFARNSAGETAPASEPSSSVS